MVNFDEYFYFSIRIGIEGTILQIIVDIFYLLPRWLFCCIKKILLGKKTHLS